MAYSHTRRIERWLRAADVLFVVAWCAGTLLLLPPQYQKSLAWAMGAAWFAGVVTVGGQNPAYLFPRYRIFVSMALSLALAALIGIFWAGDGRHWYLVGGIYFLVALGIGGTVIRFLLASVLQPTAVQLVPFRLPSVFTPLLDELGRNPHVYVEPMLEHPTDPLPERRPRFPIYLAVCDLRLREDEFLALLPLYPRIEIEDICDLYESVLRKVAVIRTDEGWMLPQAVRVPSPVFEAVKRAFDVIFVFLTLPISVPILLIAALAIKATSRGPAFFFQERLGRFGRTIHVAKLRTMVTDAEADGRRWAGAGDPRITPIGRLLRASGIDELPQFWNILIGEMSLIGPRPEVPEIATAIEGQIPFYQARLLATPGLTGWAQLHQGGDVTADDVANKLRYDLYYLKYSSLLLDLRILLGTVQMLLHLAKPAPKPPPAPPAARVVSPPTSSDADRVHTEVGV